MYARRVSLQLKPNKSADFAKRIQADVIPLLRKQKGFENEIAFTSNGGKEAFGISLWDRKESADAYDRGEYSQVKKMIENLIDGEARVDGYEVSASTFRQTTAAEVK